MNESDAVSVAMDLNNNSKTISIVEIHSLSREYFQKPPAFNSAGFMGENFPPKPLDKVLGATQSLTVLLGCRKISRRGCAKL